MIKDSLEFNLIKDIANYGFQMSNGNLILLSNNFFDFSLTTLSNIEELTSTKPSQNIFTFNDYSKNILEMIHSRYGIPLFKRVSICYDLDNKNKLIKDDSWSGFFYRMTGGARWRHSLINNEGMTLSGHNYIIIV
ncbi:hypothetical protein DMUE_5792 [Dictyocoela muelleri]|nr:hypothetical protein DMUE_5792 [Dictyocoela muelleri]